MKAQYIAEMTEGTRVDTVLAVRAREMRAARNGDAYLSLELADRTGSIPAVLFRPTREALVPAGVVAEVHGTVTSFRGVKRISVDRLRPAADWAPEDFLAVGPRDREELLGEFKQAAASVRHPELRSVLRAVFGEKTLLERFRSCPASQSYHHSYLGGLIEHTVAVATLCGALSSTYPTLDRDLVVTAALLHDLGKIEELSYDTAIEYTDCGRLVGHVVLSVQILKDALRRSRVRIDHDLQMRLEHAILAHHGELEWGSPKRPSTLEALVLHHADNLDAKAAGFEALLAGAFAADEAWTDASNLFRRPLYAPRQACDDRVVRPIEDEAYFRATA